MNGFAFVEQSIDGDWQVCWDHGKVVEIVAQGFQSRNDADSAAVKIIEDRLDN